MTIESVHGPDRLTSLITQVGRQLEIIRSEVGQAQMLLQQVSVVAAQQDARVDDTGRLEQVVAQLQQQHDRLVDAMNAKGRPERAGPPPTDFRMDFIERVARVGRRRIPLSRKEFSLLELLWKRFPEAVTREEMLTHLYQKSERPTEQVIDVFIFKVRQKLSAAGVADVRIHTGKGTGWWLEMVDDIAPVEVNAPAETVPSTE